MGDGCVKELDVQGKDEAMRSYKLKVIKELKGVGCDLDVGMLDCIVMVPLSYSGCSEILYPPT